MKRFICLLLIASPCLGAETYLRRLGVNISLPERGGTFVDLVKEGYRWHDLDSGAELVRAQVDERGWPRIDARFIYDVRPVAEWSGEIDDPERYRLDMSGTDACSFVGQAEVVVVVGGGVRNLQYDAARNLTTFDFAALSPGPNHGLFILEFRQTQRTPGDEVGTGIAEFRMLRPGYPRDSEQLFTDDLLAALNSAAFGAIRFMDFTAANGSEPQYPAVREWAQRKLPHDAAQNRIAVLDKPDGAAWEHAIALANATALDLWINVPLSASEDYVRQLARLMRERVDPALKLYVESSNEVWNTAPAFNQSLYNKAQARALGIGEHENHARRSVELSRIFAEVFGDAAINDRVRVVLCSHQPMLKWWMEPMLQYIDREWGPPRDLIYGIASQTYFSGGVADGASVEQILAAARRAIDSLIDETGSTNEAGRRQWVEKARAWDLVGGYMSYEGGPDHGGGSRVNIANRIRAERSAQMGELLRYNLVEGFWNLGGGLAMQFTLSSGYNRFGAWGLTDDIGDLDRNAKFAAVRLLLAAPTAIVYTDARPARMRLWQNAPNPFNPQTTIRYQLPHRAEVRLTVHDALGRLVAELARGQSAAGIHVAIWDAQGLASGLYFYRLVAAAPDGGLSQVIVRKALVLK